VLTTSTTEGYAARSYAESLSEFGTPRQLPLSQGWILERPISGFANRDAMGCYPLFACGNWAQLRNDLDNLQNELVCVSLVTDPFGNYDEADLKKSFTTVVPFKTHFVADLDQPIEKIVSKHHRYYALRALQQIDVETVSNPAAYLDEWSTLYNHLIDRHGLKGIKAFSKHAFAVQLQVPGLVMLRALRHGETIGMHLWYMQGNVAYSHLAAVNAVGYELMASYALYWQAIQEFAGKVRWLNFGAGAGISENNDSGLTRFKRGWATATRTAYLCGRVLDLSTYERINSARRAKGSRYFPAYREGEFD
jgi:hypothetical protein